MGDAETRLLFKLHSGTHGLMSSWVEIEIEKVSICVICAVRTVKVLVTFVKLPGLFRAPCIIFRASKNNLGNEFERFKSCDIAEKSHFILGTELWGSHYEELLRLVKSYIIDIWELCKSKLYGTGTGPLQYRSRPGRDTACQDKGKFGKLGGEKSCIVVYGSARSSECEALPFEYYIYELFSN